MKKQPLIELKNVSVRYGGIHALEDISIDLAGGEIVALMGPNGAGKSTILKAMFGLAPLAHGSVFWESAGIVPVSHEMVRRGVAFVPQGRRVFNQLTVEENLQVAGLVLPDKSDRQGRVSATLETFPVLKQKRRAKSGTLSGGQQQMLAMARGLMIDPKVLLLDEPSLGLAPKVVKEIFEKIKEVGERHQTAILIVEHNLKSLLEIVDRGYILDKGRVVAHDNARRLVESGILEKVFLGKL